MLTRVVACALSVLVLASVAGCSSSNKGANPSGPAASSSAPSPSGADALHLVVVGDSIPFGQHFCPGCTTFTDQYATYLTKRAGRKVVVANKSRDDAPGLREIETQVTTDTGLRTLLRNADVVLVSVGGNNLTPDYYNPPPGGPFPGCQNVDPTISDKVIGHLLVLTSECMDKEVSAWRPYYERIYSTVAKLRSGKPTALLALTVADADLGDSGINSVLNPKQLAVTEKHLVAVWDKWDAMLCDVAKANGFTCVDVYHALNGPKGTSYIRDLTTDGTHPNQMGHDKIAKVLEATDISKILNN